MAVHLICEGGDAGLDNRVLNNLVIQYHNLSVQMAPSGSSGGLGAVRVYLRNQSSSNIAISVEDRDYFRTQLEVNPTWANLNAKGYIWRRHEIENYLLHPRVVLALFDGYRNANVQWAAGLPATEPAVHSLLETIAAPLLENHAGEVLRVELLRKSTAPGSLQFGAIKPAANLGAIFPGQTSWTIALQQEAARLCAVSSTVAALPDFQPATIAIRYLDILATFSPATFLASGDFLLDMGGHELMAAFAAHLRDIGAPEGFTDSFLENELLQVLTSIYQPNVIYKPDDFYELAMILAKY